jgi:L-lysine exporter family protein LysE/ArgO
VESLIYAFIKGFLFSLALCLDMGVVNIAIMKTGMDRGFAASFRIGFGSSALRILSLSSAILFLGFAVNLFWDGLHSLIL